MSFLKQLRVTLSAMFGEPCDRCGSTLKCSPVFGLPLGPELAWVNRVLLLDRGAGELTAEQDVAALADRVAAYAADPRAHSDGVMLFVKWCATCQQGTLLLRLSAHGAAVEESEYSLYSEGHKQFARMVQARHAAPAGGGAGGEASERRGR